MLQLAHSLCFPTPKNEKFFMFMEMFSVEQTVAKPRWKLQMRRLIALYLCGGRSAIAQKRDWFESSLGISIAKLMISVGLPLHNGSYEAGL